MFHSCCVRSAVSSLASIQPIHLENASSSVLSVELHHLWVWTKLQRAITSLCGEDDDAILSPSSSSYRYYFGSLVESGS
jgi:hypothetical protein